MTKTKRFGWAVLTALAIATSCTPSSEDGTCAVNGIEILNADAPLKVDFDELVDSVSYIALDCKQCPVGDIDAIKRDDDMIFVKDSHGLYAFSSSGAFVSEIGTKGNGANEYHYIESFFTDRENKHVYIVSIPDNRLLKYTYDGKFISFSSLSENAACIEDVMCYTPDSLFIYNALSNEIHGRPAEYTLLSGIASQGKEEMLLKGIKNKSQDVHYPFLYHPMAKVRNTIYAASALSDIIYKYDGHGMEAAFRVPMPNLSPTATYLSTHEDMDFFALEEELNEKGVGVGITGIAAIGDNLVLPVNKARTVITDGKEGVVISSMVHDKNTDSYALSFFSGGISDDYMGYLEMDFLLKAKTKEYIMRGNNRRLQELVQTLSQDDNPVVYQYHFKKDLMEILKRKLGCTQTT